VRKRILADSLYFRQFGFIKVKERIKVPTVKRQTLSFSPIHQARKAFRLSGCCYQNMEKSSHPVGPPLSVEPVKWITMSLSFTAEPRMRIITCFSISVPSLSSHRSSMQEDGKKICLKYKLKSSPLLPPPPPPPQKDMIFVRHNKSRNILSINPLKTNDRTLYFLFFFFLVLFISHQIVAVYNL